ncbi:MAG: hypothetical protein ACREP5_00030 [Candidatus Binatia bacterium]
MTRKAKRPQKVAKWTGDGSTDIEQECGRDWVFGSYANEEVEWRKQAFHEHSRGGE